MDLTRRIFLGGLASSGVCGLKAFGVPAGSGPGGRPNIKFGVISDIHISIEDRDNGKNFGIETFVSTLEWFRDQGVDAVVIAGDLADTGLLPEMQAVADAWFRVFPDDKAPDGRRVERIFVCGNHDWDGWTYFDELIKKTYRDENAARRDMIGFGQKGCWERIWHEPFSLVWRKEVKGYSFVGAHWTAEHCIGSSLADEKGIRGVADFFAKTARFDPSRPFFYVQHPHPKNTCYGSWAWGHDDGESTKVLSAFPNAIAFSGHSHYSLTDERSIWQGAFTSLGASSLKFAGLTYNQYFPEGFENTSAPKPRRYEIDPKKVMPRLEYNTYDGRQGMLVSMFDDHVRLMRRDMISGKALGDDWIVPLPMAEPPPFAFASRAAKSTAPEFPQGATVSVRTVRDKTRGGKGPGGKMLAPVEKDVFELTFPAANAVKGARVLEYRVDVTPEGGETVVKRMMADGFYLPEDAPKANGTCVFKVAVDAFPSAKSYAFSVYPVGSLGKVGAPVKAIAAAPARTLIASAPVLQNAAETSMGVSFAVSANASGWVEYSRNADLSGAVRVYSGEGPLMDVTDKVVKIRIEGLEPATRYWYRVGADRIEFDGGAAVRNLGPERDSKIHSFSTLGRSASGSFCVINDTHDRKPALDLVLGKLAEIKPAVAIWNGDASDAADTAEKAIGTFMRPHPRHPEYAADTPFMFVMGNHDYRGRFNRHLEEVMMFRSPAERQGAYAALGRNFVQRFGDIAFIGLDTGEDKLDTNPRMGGISRMKPYREMQTRWLAEVVESDAVKSARFKVVFCHIPLFDPRPWANPGDLAPADAASGYRHDYAFWQRTCARMWSPLFEKAGVKLVIAAHDHVFRYDPPGPGRGWAQIIGGGPNLIETSFPTVIEGCVESGKLIVKVHNVLTGTVCGEYAIA